jgi:subtilase family serine protease
MAVPPLRSRLSDQFDVKTMMKPFYSTVGILLLIAFGAAPVIAQANGAATVRIVGNQPGVETMASLGTTTQLPTTTTLTMSAVIAPQNQNELDQLIAAQQNPNSSDYHHWLVPGEFTDRFGPSPDQLVQVSNWLASQGFTVTSASAADRVVRFTGSASQAETAFNVRLAAASNGTHFGNLDAPAIPANLVSLIQSIHGLDNLHALAVRPYPEVLVSKNKHAFGPQDLYSFYDENTLLDDDVNGTGADCVALIEFSDYDNASIEAFDSFFNLPAPDITTITVDGSGSFDNSAEPETLFDIEYAHAAAPEAPISVYVAGAEASTTGALLDPLQQAVTDDACGSISLSISICPGEDSSLAQSADSIYQQAATQGQTVFSASGDDGAAAIVFNATKGCVASNKRGVIETAASPNITSVGGTEVKPKYDKTTGIVIAGSAAETVWKESVGASGGGASQVFGKPAYQNALTPNDNARDIPDVSLLAAAKTPGYVYGYEGKLFCCAGGTSFASPYWAGITALMEQVNGGGNSGRPGPLNTELYRLASSGAAASGIRDVTKGNNGFHGAKGYKVTAGYDQASGWGTPDIGDLISAFTGK